MRHLLPTALVIALVFPGFSNAQVKKSGGLFGFNRDQEQISSDLFPNEVSSPQPQQVSQTRIAPASSAPAPPSQAATQKDGIFRGGSPAPVAPVSYTIEDGQKVDQKISRKKSSFFGFGKKDNANEDEAPIVSPVPPSSPYVSPTADPAVPKPVTVPAPAPIAPPAIEWSAPAPVIASNEKVEEVKSEVIPDTPEFQNVEKPEKSGGFFSFFSRKKSVPAVEPPAIASPAVASATSEKVAGAAGNATETVANTTGNVFEVPSKPTSFQEPQKEKKSLAGSLLSPVAKIRPAKKELDFTGAETIITDGEIVSNDSHSLSDRIVTTPGDGRKDPPKIINGVKTYSSWDDVEGSSVSAADKILKQIR